MDNKIKIIPLLLLLSTLGYTQEIKLIFDIKNPVLSPIEPMFYTLEIFNEGESKKLINIPWSLRNLPIIEYYDWEEKSWKILKNSDRTNYDRFPLVAGGGLTSNQQRTFSIQPKQKINKKFLFVPFDDNSYLSKDYYFKSGDSIKLRVVCTLNEGNSEVTSNEQCLYVTEYDSLNSDVYSYLFNLAIPHYIFEVAIFDPDYGGHPSPTTLDFKGIKESKYILENYPNSKFAAWADVHLAWNDYLAADKNVIEAKYRLAQDSTVALNEAKMQIINAETHLEGALASNNILVHPYAKKLYYSIIDIKMSLGMYATIEEYFNATEYVESL